MSTEEIAKEVKLSISESLKENPLTSSSIIKDFTLVHKGGNVYEGILDVEIRNYLMDEETINDSEASEFLKALTNQRLVVEVIYDGENLKWEIKDL